MRQLLAILLVWGALCTLHAADIFEQYAKKDYTSVATELEKQLDARPDDPLLWYNRGVVAERRDRKGYALFCYLQALQAAPDFPEAKNNLALVASNLGVSIPQSIATGSGDLFPMMIAFFIFLYLFVFLLIWYLFRPGWKLRLFLVPTFLFLILFATLFTLRYRDNAERLYAVVVISSDMKSGPDESLSSVGKLREGELLELRQASDGWIKAKSFQDNIEGWVHGKNIRHLARRTE